MQTISAELNVNSYEIPKKLDSAEVNSVVEYVLFEHLLRALVLSNTEGRIQGDLAESWHISHDFKEFDFKIRDNSLFSDGTIITSDDIVISLERSLNYQKTIHGNFQKIKNIKKISSLELKITLNESDPYFLLDLESPEFRITSRADSLAKTGNQKFIITSGHYSLEKILPGQISLKKNIYDTQSTFERINFSNGNELNYDVIWPGQNWLINNHKKTLSSGYKTYIPRLGFSFWISFNTDKETMRSLETRKWISSILNLQRTDLTEDNFNIDLAHQLYLPLGLGRLSEQEERSLKIKNTHKPEALNKLTILISERFPFADLFVQRLKEKNVDLILKKYKNFSEYAELIKNKNEYDLWQVNNDFSAPDLKTTIDVTFNENRPLISITKNDKKGKLGKILKQISGEQDSLKKQKEIRNLGFLLLEEARIIPLYYLNTMIYVKSHFDISGFSKITPDVGLWKLKKLESSPKK